MAHPSDVLIFVEDTGASHCVAELPAALAEWGIRSTIIAAGLAKDNLSHRGIAFEAIEYGTCPNASKILDSCRPKMLIVGTSHNPDTLALPLVMEARSAGIQNAAIVDAHGNADMRFRGRSENPLAYAPDWLLVSTTLTRDVYVSLGYSSERIIVCGHPHYDFVRETARKLSCKDRVALRRRLFPGLTDGQKLVVFASEGPARLKPRSDQYLSECTLPNTKNVNGRTELVLNEFLDAISRVAPRPYLVLRLHPRDIPDDYQEYREAFDMFHQGGSSLELIHAADYIVGMTSMLMMEAVLFEKPTLSIVPRAVETDILPAIRLGLTPCVMTRQELRDVLGNFLQDCHRLGNSVDEVIVFGALQRITTFIASRVNRQKEMQS